MFYCFPNEIQLPGTQSFSIFGSGRVGYLKKSSGRVGYWDPVSPWLPHPTPFSPRFPPDIGIFTVQCSGRGWIDFSKVLSCCTDKSVQSWPSTLQDPIKQGFDKRRLDGGPAKGSCHKGMRGRGIDLKGRPATLRIIHFPIPLKSASRKWRDFWIHR